MLNAITLESLIAQNKKMLHQSTILPLRPLSEDVKSMFNDRASWSTEKWQTAFDKILSEGLVIPTCRAVSTKAETALRFLALEGKAKIIIQNGNLKYEPVVRLEAPTKKNKIFSRLYKNHEKKTYTPKK